MSRARQIIAAAAMLALAGCSGNSSGSRGTYNDAGSTGSYGGSATSSSPILNEGNDSFGSKPSYGRNRGGSINPTAAGAGIGALVGAEAGSSLNEEDRQRAYIAAQTSFQSGQTTRWSNQATGHYGTVDPTPTYTSRTGQTCRNFSHTMWVDGRDENVKGESCRQTDGSWQISS